MLKKHQRDWLYFQAVEVAHRGREACNIGNLDAGAVCAERIEGMMDVLKFIGETELAEECARIQELTLPDWCGETGNAKEG